MKMDCYIFDIDGTIADNSHRTHHLKKQPKDWNSYHEGVADDGVHRHIRDVALTLGLANNGPLANIIFCTGRHEGQREATMNWLYQNGFVQLNQIGLYMRTEGDFRADHIVKLELLMRIRADGFNPIMAFDDRNSVVAMWRANGIPCAQVAEGDF
jgi:predicted secreted acid phosphatase